MSYLVRQSDVKPYSPANHSGTKNFRLIGPETVGARQVEMILGEIERGRGSQFDPDLASAFLANPPDR